MEEKTEEQLNQEQPQPKEPKKGYDKRTWGIVVLVAVLIVGGLVLSQTRETEVAVTNFEECLAVTGIAAESYPRQCFYGGRGFTEVIDTTEGWQTYRNREFGFELKHPSTYKVENEEQSGPYFLVSLADIKSGVRPIYSFLSASFENRSRDEVAEELFSSLIFDAREVLEDPDLEMEQVKDTSLGGKPADLLFYKSYFGPAEKIFVVELRNNRSAIIHVRDTLIDEEKLILSTFKFIE